MLVLKNGHYWVIFNMMLNPDSSLANYLTTSNRRAG